ncbi:MAG: phytanoyl-CoA dioxygenase family protein [Candidatus Poribacteria bacterium]|nr:phytanoyl-CoA dioxygenase family protein [Candidatus Poribacteria bacterium]
MSELETQQYLFDLQGYMVLEDVLSSDEVVTLNRLIDAQNLPQPGLEAGLIRRFGSAAGAGPEGPGFLEWGKPFCGLLDHPRIMPILRFMLGECFRLDRIYGIYMREGTTALGLHGGNTPYSPGEYYHVRDGRIHNGFTVVAWNLTDTGPQSGGFICIPGSHKSNFKIPKEILETPEKAPCAVIPEVRAGSVVLFTEALTHGTAAWRGKHQRRSLLYKYCQSQVAWSNKRVKLPKTVELTPRQKILFGEPANPGNFFPSLFEPEFEKDN